jgi:hypothetical protein
MEVLSRSVPAQNRATAGRQFVREGIGEQVVGGVRQGHNLGVVVEQDLPVAAVGCVSGDGFR